MVSRIPTDKMNGQTELFLMQIYLVGELYPGQTEHGIKAMKVYFTIARYPHLECPNNFHFGALFRTLPLLEGEDIIYLKRTLSFPPKWLTTCCILAFHRAVTFQLCKQKDSVAWT